MIVDASVVVKWQLDDEDAVDQALAIRDDYLVHGHFELVAPFLLVFELTNAMVSATRHRRVSQAHAEEGLGHLLAAGVRLISVDAARVFSLAMQWKVSAYDGAYLGLAEKLDSEVWTGDRRFHTACRGRGSRVRWIGDYRGPVA